MGGARGVPAARHLGALALRSAARTRPQAGPDDELLVGAGRHEQEAADRAAHRDLRAGHRPGHHDRVGEHGPAAWLEHAPPLREHVRAQRHVTHGVHRDDRVEAYRPRTARPRRRPRRGTSPGPRARRRRPAARPWQCRLSLMSMPVTRAPVRRARCRAGPPDPQPTSSTCCVSRRDRATRRTRRTPRP